MDVVILKVVAAFDLTLFNDNAWLFFNGLCNGSFDMVWLETSFSCTQYSIRGVRFGGRCRQDGCGSKDGGIENDEFAKDGHFGKILEI